MRPISFVCRAVILLLAAACAGHGAPTSISLAGSDQGIQPVLRSVGQFAGTSYRMSVTVPRSTYLTSVVIFTGASARVITPNADTATIATALDAGSHELLLAPARYVGGSATFARRPRHGRDGSTTNEDGRAVKSYALVVTSPSPIALADVQATLDNLDLRGLTDADVLAEVSRAVGSLAAGRWGAAALPLQFLHNGI